MSTNLKKRSDVVGYIHNVSPMKTSKSSNVQYFSALIQSRDQTWHAFSYSTEKHEQFQHYQQAQQAIKILNVAFVTSKRRADTLDIFIDKRTTIEAALVDFTWTSTDEGEDYTNISDIVSKMQHRDKVNVCVKVTSEDSHSDVELTDGTITKRSVFQVADGTGAITLSVFGKKQIKQIRTMPLVRLKNVFVQVVDGQMTLSTFDSTSISTVRKSAGASPHSSGQEASGGQADKCSGLMTCLCALCKKNDPQVSSQMPCWYFEKNDLIYTPSFYDGVDPETEARYRREGARFILDTGTKMGLKFDSCGTGVVYFHRFYMEHSFREFNRYVTGACCLFLAGKVEETPKKCKDIIKATREMLTDNQFSAFGDDPKEEVMTLERVLLQTIKFDLRVEHPYGYILKYAKQIKGDKEKVQKLIQMAWTFINDSMCTSLCLQWEADMIAVALMYLAGRLTKYEITDWQGKVLGSKKKWWDSFVEDATMDLLEDICHQVLDLYSAPVIKRDSSPPLPRHDPQVMMAAIKAKEQQEQLQKQQQEAQLLGAKQRSQDKRSKEHTSKKIAKAAAAAQQAAVNAATAPVPPPLPITPVTKDAPLPPQLPPGPAPVAAVPHPAGYQGASYNQSYNMSASSIQDQSRSFMSGEGAQSIRNLMGSYPSTSSTATYTNSQQQSATPGQYPPNYQYNAQYTAQQYAQQFAVQQAQQTGVAAQTHATQAAAASAYYNQFYQSHPPYTQYTTGQPQYTYPQTTGTTAPYAAPANYAATTAASVVQYAQSAATNTYPQVPAYQQQPAAPTYNAQPGQVPYAGQPAQVPQVPYANNHYSTHPPNYQGGQ